MMGLPSRLAIAATALLLAACNPVANLKQADADVARFHEVYSSGDVDGLFALTGPQFHQLTTRKQFQDLFDLVNSRLGRVKSSERQGFNFNTTGEGTFTNVTMDTKFDRGEGIETFVFIGNGDDMKLEGWHVDSDRFLVNAADLARERETAAPAPKAAD